MLVIVHIFHLKGCAVTFLIVTIGHIRVSNTLFCDNELHLHENVNPSNPDIKIEILIYCHYTIQ